MTVPVWSPGTLYQPGDLVRPLAAPSISSTALTNPSFEDGDTGWIKTGLWAIGTTPFGPYDGTYFGIYEDGGGSHNNGDLVNNTIAPVSPGQRITAQAFIAANGNNASSHAGGTINLYFWDASTPGGYGTGTPVSTATQSIGAQVTAYRRVSLSAVAPPGAAYVQFGVSVYRNGNTDEWLVDACSWDYVYPLVPSDVVFKAVQANAATSGSVQPTWDYVLGHDTTDGGVTWEAVESTRVTWEAHHILISGSSEPTWPTLVGGTVADNTIGWEAISRQITDAKCPNSSIVAIAASKVFAGDSDIVPFSATVNPNDWSTANDAGYLPFGLQSYGSNDISAMGLYRHNLVVFSPAAFQMWQVDEDPANMALLDAVPVGCRFQHSLQPLADDLIFLSDVGVRNIGIAGASTNLQANAVGQPIDSLVQPQVRNGVYEPIGLYVPAFGQYWLFFGPQAFVLTINSANKKSWSRYVFPDTITDWTLDESDLVLRSAGNLVWRVSLDALYDDIQQGSRTLGAVETGGLVVGYDTIGTPFGTLDNTSLGSNTIVALSQNTSVPSDPLMLQLIVSSTSAPLAQDAFAQMRITNITTGEITILKSSDASLLPGNPNTAWQWTLDQMVFVDGESYAIGFDTEGTVDFTGLVQWPHLDCGTLGIEKNMVGIDLISTAPTGVQVSIGYDQRDLTKRTAPYTIDADTFPGPPIPIPVSGPSFDVQLTFAAGQEWEVIAANLYLAR